MVSSMQRKKAGRFWKEEKLELSVIIAKTKWFKKAN